MSRDESGFTLIELLVTVVLMAVVAVISFGFIDQVTSVSSTASRQVISEADAQTALREMTQEIRGANPISSTSSTLPAGTCPTSTTFPAGSGRCLRFALVTSTDSTKSCLTTEFGRVPAPYRVITYGLVGGAGGDTLYKHQTSYSATCVATVGAAPGRAVLRGLQNTAAGRSLFTYSDRNGAAVASGAPVDDAGSVRLTLMVPYEGTSPLLVLTSVASFRNN